MLSLMLQLKRGNMTVLHISLGNFTGFRCHCVFITNCASLSSKHLTVSHHHAFPTPIASLVMTHASLGSHIKSCHSKNAYWLERSCFRTLDPRLETSYHHLLRQCELYFKPMLTTYLFHINNVRLFGCLTIWLSDSQTVWLSDCRTVRQSDRRTTGQADNRTVRQPDNWTVGQSDSKTAGQFDSETVRDSQRQSEIPLFG